MSEQLKVNGTSQQELDDKVEGACALSADLVGEKNTNNDCLAGGDEGGGKCGEKSEEEDEYYKELLEQMKCFKCQKLMESPIYENSDCQRICSECYEKLPSAPDCSKCVKDVGEEYYIHLELVYCIQCYEEFCKEKYLKVAAAYTCNSCKKVKKGGYYTPNSLYCPPCKIKSYPNYTGRAGPVPCSKCNTDISDDYYFCSSKNYCKGCFSTTGVGDEKKRFTKERKKTYVHSLYMESCTEFIFYPCRHTDCDAKMKLNNRKEHEDSCKMRILNCALCKWEGIKGEFLQHAKTKHAFSMISTQSSYERGAVFALCKMGNDQAQNYLQAADGKMFKISCFLKDSVYFFWIQCYGSEREAMQYKFSFYLESDGWKMQKECRVTSDLEVIPPQAILHDKEWMERLGLLSERGTNIKFKIKKVTEQEASCSSVAQKMDLLSVE